MASENQNEEQRNKSKQHCFKHTTKVDLGDGEEVPVLECIFESFYIKDGKVFAPIEINILDNRVGKLSFNLGCPVKDLLELLAEHEAELLGDSEEKGGIVKVMSDAMRNSS